MAIKKLQSNYTTAEQSKRLLELGVPVDSADCYLNGDSVIMLNGKTFQENYNEDLDLARLHLVEYPHYIPGWSVGRLIEIFEICTGLVWQNEVIDGYTKLDMLLEDFEDVENKYHLDFSKLEEEL